MFRAIRLARISGLTESLNSQKYGNFKDSTYVVLKGGKGGDGSCSCEIFDGNRGKPNGGNGGKGGNVVFKVDQNCYSLNHLSATIKGENGTNGGSNNMMGKNTPDTIIYVPLGTSIRTENIPEDEIPEEEEREYIEIHKSWLRRRDTRFPKHPESVSLDEIDSSVVVAHGGLGGLGNRSLNGPKEQKEKGFPGEFRKIKVSMETIADIGLVGFPNVGKSSMLSVVSNATPKIADYPFTTLRPYVGVIEFPHHSIRVTDIPGIIKGAHLNKGLGHEFLRHIVKSRILAIVADLGDPNVIESISTILHELESYKTGLSLKCKMIIANKIDKPEGFKSYELIKEHFSDYPVYPISCRYKIGIEGLVSEINYALATGAHDNIARDQ